MNITIYVEKHDFDNVLAKKKPSKLWLNSSDALYSGINLNNLVEVSIETELLAKWNSNPQILHG